MEKKESRSLLKEIRNMVLYIGLIILISIFMITFVAQRTEVIGNSMYSTLKDGDHLIIDKLSYRFRDIERFDIVVFKYKYKENRFYIKRVIGLPGDTLQITDGIIYINGQILEEDYGYEPIEKPKRASEPITLGEDEYFVLGDNRNSSADSRESDVGNVKQEQIVGKAFLKIWPLNEFHVLKHQ